MGRKAGEPTRLVRIGKADAEKLLAVAGYWHVTAREAFRRVAGAALDRKAAAVAEKGGK